MIQAIHDNLLVKNIPHDPKTIVYIPPEFRRKLRHAQRGLVISAGKGTDVLPMPVTAGNEIMYEKEAGFDIEVNEEKYRSLKTFHIICAR